MRSSGWTRRGTRRLDSVTFMHAPNSITDRPFIPIQIRSDDQSHVGQLNSNQACNSCPLSTDCPVNNSTRKRSCDNLSSVLQALTSAVPSPFSPNATRSFSDRTVSTKGPSSPLRVDDTTFSCRTRVSTVSRSTCSWPAPAHSYARSVVNSSTCGRPMPSSFASTCAACTCSSNQRISATLEFSSARLLYIAQGSSNNVTRSRMQHSTRPRTSKPLSGPGSPHVRPSFEPDTTLFTPSKRTRRHVPKVPCTLFPTSSRRNRQDIATSGWFWLLVAQTFPIPSDGVFNTAQTNVNYETNFNSRQPTLVIYELTVIFPLMPVHTFFSQAIHLCRTPSVKKEGSSRSTHYQWTSYPQWNYIGQHCVKPCLVNDCGKYRSVIQRSIS